MTRPAASSTLADRYGNAGPGRRRALLGGVGLVVAAFLGWLAWATWAQATPQVESELTTFEIVDDHAVDVRVRVSLASGVDARCVVSALSDDHQTVGELGFAPTDGDNDVTIRTERRATAVQLIGCTAPEQSRPR